MKGEARLAQSLAQQAAENMGLFRVFSSPQQADSAPGQKGDSTGCADAHFEDGCLGRGGSDAPFSLAATGPKERQSQGRARNKYWLMSIG
jgi:hypothetical protein